MKGIRLHCLFGIVAFWYFGSFGLASEKEMPILTLDHFEKYPETYCPEVGFEYTTKERFQTTLKLQQFMGTDESQTEFRSSFKKFLLHSFKIHGESKQRKTLDRIDDMMDEFIVVAKKFDPKMNDTNIYRAKTNIWVVFVLQRLFAMTLAVTDPGLGFSMLYPYTDDLIDKPDISKGEKKRFVQSFDRQIEFGDLPVKNIAALPEEFKTNYNNVWRSLALIEKHYDRETYPSLYAALLTLHRAQIESQRQQLAMGELPPTAGSEAYRAFEQDIFSITSRKGAASILSDAYLVKGFLKSGEVSFANHFGAITQFINDLGTVREDIIKEAHYTPANLFYAKAMQAGTPVVITDAMREELDLFTSRIFWYVHEVFSDARHQAIFAGKKEKYRDFFYNIKVYLNAKFIMCVAKNHEFHSKKFLNHMKKYSPLPFSLLAPLQELQEKGVKLEQLRKDQIRAEVDLGIKTELKELFDALVDSGENINKTLIPAALPIKKGLFGWLFKKLVSAAI